MTGGGGLFDSHFAADVVGGALGSGGCADQNPAVLAEHARPAFDVAGLHRLGVGVLNARKAAQERCAKLGDQFLEGILFDPVAFGFRESVQASRCAGGIMGKFMEKDRVIFIRALELTQMRQ